MTLAGGLIMLLVVIVIGDFYVALHENKHLYEKMKSIGLCAVYFVNDIFFMSPDLLQEIRSNEISGFDVKTLNKDELKGGTVVYV